MGDGQERQLAGRPARGNRQPPHVRRRLIVEAARSVIARRGLAATRMREVASSAGVSLGTFTYHFTSVAELLAEVIRTEATQFLQPIVDQALAADTGRDGLRCLVDELFKEDQRTREHWLLWFDFWTLASHDPTYRHWQDESYDAWRRVIAELVARGQVDGSLTVTDQTLAIHHFMALIDGAAVQAYLTGRDSSIDSKSPSALVRALVADLFRFPADAVAPAKVDHASEGTH